MARNYPGSLATFVAGKFIGAVRHAAETLNWMRDFCGNLKGDGDVSNAGKIRLDVSDPRNPVIRFAGGAAEAGLEVTDSDGTTNQVEHLTFASATDSNVTVKFFNVSGTAATLKIGVYWK